MVKRYLPSLTQPLAHTEDAHALMAFFAVLYASAMCPIFSCFYAFL